MVFKKLFDIASEAMILVEQESGLVVEANLAAGDLFGIKLDKNNPDHLSKWLPEETEAFKFNLSTTPEEQFVGNVKFITCKGCEVSVEIKSQKIEDQGKVLVSNTLRPLAENKESPLSSMHDHLSILSQIEAAVMVTDLSGVIRVWNKGLFNLFGYDGEYAVGQKIDFLFPKSSEEILVGQYQSILDGSNGRIVELEACKAGGEEFICRFAGFLLRDLEEKPFGIVYYSTDVTEYKVTERKLMDSENLFESVANAAQDGFVILNSKGEITYWNHAAERIFGYKRDEVIGEVAHKLITPARHQKDASQGWNAFKSSGDGPVIGKTLELPAVRRGGDEIPIELSVSSVKIQGEWHGIGIVRDITKRVETEKRLKQKDRRLAEAQRIANLGSWELDIKTDTVSCSEETCRILGMDKEVFTGSNEAFLKLVYPDDREKVIQALKDSLESKVPYQLVHRLLMKDGSIKYVRGLGIVRFDESDQPYSMVGTIQDITHEYLIQQNLNQSNRALKTLSRGNKTLTKATDEARLLEDMCHVVTGEASYRLAWIGYVEHDENKTLRPVAHAGYEEGYLERLNLTWDDRERGRGPAGTCIRTGKPVVIRDVETDPRFLPWREDAIQRGYSSVMSLPIKDHGVSFACLNIYSSEKDAFNDDEIKLLSELAEDIGFGIISLRIHRERDEFQAAHLEMVERHKKALISTIRAISLTIEKRDPYTAGHQLRVADLSFEIGKEMGLSEQQLEGLRFGAMIHDIGKIYVPAELLNRPGRLTEAEFSVIKSHAEVGYDIMKDVEFPWPVAEMIRQHHERLDGSGYPQGLKTDEIILEAKIIAVADVVEAITAHRPYRVALGVEIALKEIEKNRGVLFDATVVDTCIDLFLNKGYVFNETNVLDI